MHSLCWLQKQLGGMLESELFFCISWCLISFVLVNIYKAQGINIAYCISYVMYFLIIYLNLNKIIKKKNEPH